ncbi:Scr1 family TA system antitoxin-like transcriptional regulator [Streptomyces sp. NPDC048155]|uniref:Scr1 family TA system antitoxin-like transcriptional regulator n=1 Tax=Streptomyces sp. NPDC048155 TaxID=3154818 RepID=UPI0033DF2042
MPVATHPAIRAVGGYLRDARERRLIWPAQPADLIRVSEETVLSMEAGHTPIALWHIELLCQLYHCSDDIPVLKNLASAAMHRSENIADEAPGHHRRLAGCARQAREVRWLSTALIPPPLQTAAYARAVGCPSPALPDAPLPSPHTAYVLDERILLTDRVAPEVMAPQLQYLLGLDVDELSVVPGRIAAPQGHLVELRMPAGTVFARPEHDGVLYLLADMRLSALMSDTWELITPAASRELLVYAAQEQLSRAYVHTGAARCPEPL